MPKRRAHSSRTGASGRSMIIQLTVVLPPTASPWNSVTARSSVARNACSA
jgi:hypothetical protein